MQKRIFNAGWDKLLKTVTFSVILITLIVIAYSFHIPSFAGAAIRVPLCLILGAAFLFAPKYYIIGEGKISIKRYLGKTSINISDVADIRAIDGSQLKYAIRTFGVGGFFGYYGLYWSKSLGSFKAYITDRNNCVLLQTRQGKRFVLSPDNRLEFVEMIKAAMQ